HRMLTAAVRALEVGVLDDGDRRRGIAEVDAAPEIGLPRMRDLRLDAPLFGLLARRLASAGRGPGGAVEECDELLRVRPDGVVQDLRVLRQRGLELIRGRLGGAGREQDSGERER